MIQILDLTGCGVYIIECIPTGDAYVGASSNYFARLHAHISGLRGGLYKVANGRLQELWNIHGPRLFQFTVLEDCEARHLSIKERKWIKSLNPSLNTVVDAMPSPNWPTQDSE